MVLRLLFLADLPLATLHVRFISTTNELDAVERSVAQLSSLVSDYAATLRSLSDTTFDVSAGTSKPLSHSFSHVSGPQGRGRARGTRGNSQLKSGASYLDVLSSAARPPKTTAPQPIAPSTRLRGSSPERAAGSISDIGVTDTDEMEVSAAPSECLCEH